MHNVTHEIVGDKLVITIDLSKAAIDAAPPSSTGKTHLVAATGAALPVACKHAAVTFSMNVMAKKGR